MISGGIPRLVIGGTTSGVGKTTLSTGLMAALRRRGLRVQPFKVGPDYIDPSYHRAATGVPSRNLDSWMVPREALLELFQRACQGADVALIEGVMGVFDGSSGRDEAGSTAEIAKLLNAPVLLLMNAGKMARSAGAMALGYARFDPDLRVTGFLLNNVAGEGHYRMAREAIEGCGIGPVLGYLPRDPLMALPERHLGLVPTAERSLPEGFLERLVGLIEAHVDVEGILEIAASAGPLPAADERAGSTAGHDSSLVSRHSSLFPPEPLPTRATIALATDEAFNFYYQDNLDLLCAHGARLLPFSPLRDAAVPAGADALYLGGGFPELHAAQLAGNDGMLRSMRRAADAGMPIYAECGGLMYLTQGIVDTEKGRHPMVGLLPGWCTMEGSRLHLGYVEVTSLHPTPLGPAGTRARGHEFHWSRWEGLETSRGAYRILNQGDRIEGCALDNLLATFVHLHFGANPDLAPSFVESAHAYRIRREGGRPPCKEWTAFSPLGPQGDPQGENEKGEEAAPGAAQS
ncbi:MAG: cobyrinate a,c-diamide synthase [Chloroflexota bacterium]